VDGRFESEINDQSSYSTNASGNDRTIDYTVRLLLTERRRQRQRVRFVT